MKVGDTVRQGEYLAEIHFMGLPHVHLSRVFLESGLWSDYSNIRSVQPDGFFSYRDDEPPVIEPGFRYYANESDSLLGMGDGSMVYGDVDIVVAMREQGYYAHSKGGMVEAGYGDRLSVSRIEYDITGPDGHTRSFRSFNFMTMTLGQYPGLVDRVFTVYKFLYTVLPDGPASWSKVSCYYIITNTDGTDKSGELKPSDRNFSWQTDSAGADGTRLYPDGLYRITVRAYDSRGNCATASESVWVDNSPHLQRMAGPGRAKQPTRHVPVAIESTGE